MLTSVRIRLCGFSLHVRRRAVAVQGGLVRWHIVLRLVDGRMRLDWSVIIQHSKHCVHVAELSVDLLCYAYLKPDHRVTMFMLSSGLEKVTLVDDHRASEPNAK